MDIYVLFLIQTITLIFAVIFAYITVKNAKKEAKETLKQLIPTLLSENSVNLLLQTLINNEKYQKFLFESGAIAGQGAKTAIGGAFGGAKTGKGLIGQILGSIAEQATKSIMPGQQTSTNPEPSKGL